MSFVLDRVEVYVRVVGAVGVLQARNIGGDCGFGWICCAMVALRPRRHEGWDVGEAVAT